MFFEPRSNPLRKVACQAAHFIGLTGRRDAGGVIFGAVAPLSEGIEAADGLRIETDGESQAVQRVIVRVPGFSCQVARRRKRGLRGLECRVVRDVEAPVRA